jgi:hypothetical protein
MKTRIVISILLLLAVTACSKYRLNGDKEVLIGEWMWVSSELQELGANGVTYTQHPDTAGLDASFIIAKRNRMLLMIDGAQISHGRIKFDYFEAPSDPTSDFAYVGKFEYKSDGETLDFMVYVTSNSNEIFLDGYPFVSDDNATVNHNFYRRK